MHPTPLSASEALAGIETWRRPLFQRLPSDFAANKAARRQISRRLTELFEAIVLRLAPEFVVEIGAHEATFSSEIKLALPSARVIALEANPHVFDHHCRRLAAAGVEYVHACVADSAGPKRFLVPMDGDRRRLRMGSMLTHQSSSDFIEWEVDGVTLDGFMGEQARRPNAIWLDVEGAAGAVIDGAAVTLANCQAMLIELETEPRWAGQRLEGDITAQLGGLGLVPVASDIQTPWQFNLLFLNQARLDTRLAAECRAFRSASEALLAAAAPDKDPS